jgi:hypothetical protein
MELKVDGLKDFRRDLKRLGPEVDKDLRREIRDASTRVLQEARAVAPVRTGTLARSLKVSVTQRGASIYSDLPYAPIVHWGGTISPRGVPITFERTEFISRPAERQADSLAEDIAEGVERAARRVGWH